MMPLFLCVKIRCEGQIPFERFLRRRVIPLLFVHRRDVVHVVLRQLEIEQIDVRADVLRVARARNHDVAELRVPAQDNLRD